MHVAIQDLTDDDVFEFWVKIDKSRDCWFRGAVRGKYTHFRKHPAHRVALWFIKGPPPEGKEQACHGPCHERACVNPAHLSWGSAYDNSQDKKRDGTLVGRPKHEGVDYATEDFLRVRLPTLPRRSFDTTRTESTTLSAK